MPITGTIRSPAVPTDTSPEFDLGPLSWVQGEIDQALTRGLDSLAAFKAAPNDSTALKHARQHVHQAAGAIQMVGLDAVVAFTDEIERQLTLIEEMPAAEAATASDNVDRACRKLRIFLDELVNGAPPVPLKLFPEYEAMQASRGIKAVAPTDLFYPDLSPRAPKIPPREAIPSAKLPSYLVKQRRMYQRGLLAWLRGDEEGARAMRDAIAGIEDATAPAGLRAFWWTVGALLEALTENGLEPGFGVKQLAARIDLQIRRVVEGSAKVAERLRREVLYYVAISAPVAPQIQAVQRAFRLSGLIPSAEVLSADLVRIQPLLREAREQLAGAKDSWLKFASGRAENLPKLKQTLTSVHTKAAEVRNGALMQLTSALVERLDKMPASGVTEPVAMEYATALLLAESAFENYSNLGGDFPKQVEAMLARLDAARAGQERHRARCPDARRDVEARAGTRAAGAGRPRDPGQPPSHGAGARRVLPRQQQARRPGDADEGQPADPRCVDDARPERGRPPAGVVPAADRELRNLRRAGFERRPRDACRIAVRASGSISKRSSSSVPIATG
jgi:chemosensory pili system protein ChpA (sensor histidine kinase/response regulator)